MSTSASQPKKPFTMRKKLVVNPRFQWITVLSLMACVFTVNAVSGLLLLQFHSRVVRFQIFSPERYADSGYSALWIASVFAIASGTLCALGFGIWSLVFTNRICGPVYVMHDWVRKTLSGQRPAIRPLRAEDAFQEFGTDLADLLRTWTSDASARKTTLSIALEEIEQAQNVADEPARKRLLASAIERIRESDRLHVEFEGGSTEPSTELLTEKAHPSKI